MLPLEKFYQLYTASISTKTEMRILHSQTGSEEKQNQALNTKIYPQDFCAKRMQRAAEERLTAKAPNIEPKTAKDHDSG